MHRASRFGLGVGCALLIAGCGAGAGGGTTTGGATTGESAGAGKFKASDVAFTFDYPDGFHQVDEDNDKVLAIVTPAQNDVDNGLKIRQTAAKELPFSAYLDTFQKQFERTIPQGVEKRMETHNGVDMGVLSFTGSVNQGAQKQQVTSASYFFAGGGKTWQLECLSRGDQYKSQIEDACKQAVDSIKFS